MTPPSREAAQKLAERLRKGGWSLCDDIDGLQLSHEQSAELIASWGVHFGEAERAAPDLAARALEIRAAMPPQYLYGNNEAACWMADKLLELAELAAGCAKGEGAE